MHKGVYAFSTGLVADRLIPGPPGVPAPREPWEARGTRAETEAAKLALRD